MDAEAAVGVVAEDVAAVAVSEEVPAAAWAEEVCAEAAVAPCAEEVGTLVEVAAAARECHKVEAWRGPEPGRTWATGPRSEMPAVLGQTFLERIQTSLAGPRWVAWEPAEAGQAVA